MKAVTWTQVAQYIILIVAYMIPVVWLSVKQTGIPVPQLVYGAQMQKVTEREQKLIDDPKEKEVREIYRQRAAAADAKLKEPGQGLRRRARRARQAARGRQGGQQRHGDQGRGGRDRQVPQDRGRAKAAWTRERGVAARANPPLRTARRSPQGRRRARHRAAQLPRAGVLPDGRHAALPHILMRYYTTPSVQQARTSVPGRCSSSSCCTSRRRRWRCWSSTRCTTTSSAPRSATCRSGCRPGPRSIHRLLSVIDVNRDGVVQLAEISIGGDIVVLATREIGGLPYVISGWWPRRIGGGAVHRRRAAADDRQRFVARLVLQDDQPERADRAPRDDLQDPAAGRRGAGRAGRRAETGRHPVPGVGGILSLAAAGFFPALVCGIFWKRTTAIAASLGMVAGVGITFYYMVMTQPWLHKTFGIDSPIAQNIWSGIQPISAGIFGVPLGFAVIILVSLITRRRRARCSSWSSTCVTRTSSRPESGTRSGDGPPDARTIARAIAGPGHRPAFALQRLGDHRDRAAGHSSAQMPQPLQ